ESQIGALVVPVATPFLTFPPKETISAMPHLTVALLQVTPTSPPSAFLVCAQEPTPSAPATHQRQELSFYPGQRHVNEGSYRNQYMDTDEQVRHIAMRCECARRL